MFYIPVIDDCDDMMEVSNYCGLLLAMDTTVSKIVSDDHPSLVELLLWYEDGFFNCLYNAAGERGRGKAKEKDFQTGRGTQLYYLVRKNHLETSMSFELHWKQTCLRQEYMSLLPRIIPCTDLSLEGKKTLRFTYNLYSTNKHGMQSSVCVKIYT